jgi:hypothetical protein
MSLLLLFNSSVSGVGALASTEADDTVSATATLDLSAAASVTEAADTVSAAGTLDIFGSAALTEADDVAGSAAAIQLRRVIKSIITAGGITTSGLTSSRQNLLASTSSKQRLKAH